jgi:hypothetical protein
MSVAHHTVWNHRSKYMPIVLVGIDELKWREITIDEVREFQEKLDKINKRRDEINKIRDEFKEKLMKRQWRKDRFKR